jgi:hypothetical protein
MAIDLDDPDLDLNADLDLDLDLDLDDYLLHPQPQSSIRVIHAFMDDRTIEHVREETVRIVDGVLRQEQLIWCIKQQQQQQFGLSRVHFKLRAMFLYNMDLEAEEMRDFLQTNPLQQSQSQQSQSQRFITPISAVEDVTIKPTIPTFARLNALHVMYEASNHQPHHSQHNQSKKRVVIRPHPRPNKNKRMHL